MLICDLASCLGLQNERRLKMDLKDLEGLGMVTGSQKEVFGRKWASVRLTPNWMDVVEALKGIGSENEAAENQRKYHDRQRAAYQQWLMDRDEERTKYLKWVEERMNKGNRSQHHTS
jgi:hypothetical protein